MIEQMEEEGVVGPQEGTKPREVYVSAIGPKMSEPRTSRKRRAISAAWWSVSSSCCWGGPRPRRRAVRTEQPPGCAEELALRIQEYYEGVRDLRADFSQSSRNVVLGDRAR